MCQHFNVPERALTSSWRNNGSIAYWSPTIILALTHGGKQCASSKRSKIDSLPWKTKPNQNVPVRSHGVLNPWLLTRPFCTDWCFHSARWGDKSILTYIFRGRLYSCTCLTATWETPNSHRFRLHHQVGVLIAFTLLHTFLTIPPQTNVGDRDCFNKEWLSAASVVIGITVLTILHCFGVMWRVFRRGRIWEYEK